MKPASQALNSPPQSSPTDAIPPTSKDGRQDTEHSSEVEEDLPELIEPVAHREVQDVVRQVESAVVRVEARSEEQGALGSGFVATPNGLVITNYHVIEGATEARVIFPDGLRCEVKGVAAFDVENDLAVLKVQANDEFEYLELADALPERGARAIAIGAPRGFTGTVTDGLISAIRTGRELEDITGTLVGAPDSVWLQTSAQIDLGNSGGPLLDMQGKVVGVNTQHYSIEASIRYNFAISAKHVDELLAGTTFAVLPFKFLPRKPTPKREPPPPSIAETIAAAEKDRVRVLEEGIQNAKEQAERSRQVLALRDEIRRLEREITRLKSEMRSVESDGANLSSRRASVLGRANGLQVEANRVAVQIRARQSQIAALSYSLKQRVVDGVMYLPNVHHPQFTVWELQRAGLLAEIESLQREASLLASQYTELATVESELRRQILYRATQYSNLSKRVEELNRELSNREFELGSLAND